MNGLSVDITTGIRLPPAPLPRSVRTLAEPVPHPGGRIFHVYPHGHTGPKTEPSFEGLVCAYNFWCAGSDWATAGRPRVRPGDTILVQAGTYKYDRYEYTNNAAVNRTTPLDGTYYLTADGTPEMPISIRAAGDGDVIFDGNGNYALFDVRAADCTLFEGITFRNAEIAILAGTQFLAGATGLAVKRSRFERVGAGIFTNSSITSPSAGWRWRSIDRLVRSVLPGLDSVDASPRRRARLGRYFARLATSSSLAMSATLRVNWISSPETIFPV